ncbi:hypothetical protein SKAU_G00099560 [Synaphobranchus kaupii]|uniref:Uncharacterized protein n=1 Tax=Synaphobranchus kaupii TaxID=118154 RepID=A0A9Q1FZ35_SYNKA|nr:hypothetical protein SKAU_G00099560 [Synaphobranchus kaupii]
MLDFTTDHRKARGGQPQGMRMAWSQNLTNCRNLAERTPCKNASPPSLRWVGTVKGPLKGFWALVPAATHRPLYSTLSDGQLHACLFIPLSKFSTATEPGLTCTGQTERVWLTPAQSESRDMDRSSHATVCL